MSRGKINAKKKNHPEKRFYLIQFSTRRLNSESNAIFLIRNKKLFGDIFSRRNR